MCRAAGEGAGAARCQRFNVAENGSASYSPIGRSLSLSLSPLPLFRSGSERTTGAVRWTVVARWESRGVQEIYDGYCALDKEANKVNNVLLASNEIQSFLFPE